MCCQGRRDGQNDAKSQHILTKHCGGWFDGSRDGLRWRGLELELLGEQQCLLRGALGLGQQA